MGETHKSFYRSVYHHRYDTGILGIYMQSPDEFMPDKVKLQCEKMVDANSVYPEATYVGQVYAMC